MVAAWKPRVSCKRNRTLSHPLLCYFPHCRRADFGVSDSWSGHSCPAHAGSMSELHPALPDVPAFHQARCMPAPPACLTPFPPCTAAGWTPPPATRWWRRCTTSHALVSPPRRWCTSPPGPAAACLTTSSCWARAGARVSAAGCLGGECSKLSWEPAGVATFDAPCLKSLAHATQCSL